MGLTYLLVPEWGLIASRRAKPSPFFKPSPGPKRYPHLGFRTTLTTSPLRLSFANPPDGDGPSVSDSPVPSFGLPGELPAPAKVLRQLGRQTPCFAGMRGPINYAILAPSPIQVPSPGGQATLTSSLQKRLHLHNIPVVTLDSSNIPLLKLPSQILHEIIHDATGATRLIAARPWPTYRDHPARTYGI